MRYPVIGAGAVGGTIGALLGRPATHLDPGVVIASGHPYPGMLHVGRHPGGADLLDRAE